jgi:peptide subunit release factor 1 (eRF1)
VEQELFDRRKDLCDGMTLEYITTRELENSAGQVTGRIRIVKLKEEPEANVDYTCPACGFSEKKKEVWKKPFVTTCGKCGYKIKVISLKAEIKKLKKKQQM